MTQLQLRYQRRACRDYGLIGMCWVLPAAALALAACAFEDTREHCASSKDCALDQVCYQSFCILADDTDSLDRGSGSPGAEAASSGGGGNGAGGRSAGAARGDTGSMRNASTAGGKGGAGGGMSAPGNAPAAASGGMSAPDNAPAAASGGMSAPSSATAAGSGGMSNAGAASSGGAPPAGGCRDGDERQCALGEPTASAGCNHGYQRCAGGSWGACMAQPQPAPESCNGKDDDCDAIVDEQSDVDCFPNGEAGCTSDTGGHFSCAGVCSIGKQACIQGQLGQCGGYRAPAAEMCTPAGGSAADENCNGMIDETCACTSGEMRSCYNGPAGTLNVGKCVAGTQTCTNGALAPCLNAVMPAPEICNNADDDCNGKVDDKIDLQVDALNCGACGKVCASGEGCCRGACVQTALDANNCGTCGAKCAGGDKCEAGKCTAGMPMIPPPPMPGTCTPACAAGQTCCAGSCVDTRADAKHCGGCGMACTAGTQPACCDGKCVDLISNAHCGQCGKDCSLLGDGSITCSCTRDAGGAVACTGPVLNLCL